MKIVMNQRLSIWMFSICALLAALPVLADSTPIQQGDTTHPHKFLVTSSADHITGLTGQATALTTALRERKNASSTVTPTGTITEEDSTNFPGVYDYTPSAGDVNTLGEANFHTSVSGSDPVDFSFIVVAYNQYDATRLGLTALPNANAGASGGLPTGDGSGRVTVGTNADKTGYTASTVSDKTGYFLSGSQTFSTSGSVASVSGSVGSVAGSVGSVTGSVGSISGVTFPGNFGTFSIDGSGRVLLQPSQPSVTIPTVTTVGTLTTNGDKTGYALTSGEHTTIAGDVLNSTASSFNTAGTIGQKINGAGTAGDPWTTSLPGSYTSGQAGYIVGHNVDSPISGIAAASMTALLGASFITLPGTATTTGVGETLTQKQIQALAASVSSGDSVQSGPPVANGSATVTYYLPGAAHTSGNVTEIATVHFDANKVTMTRSVLIAQPFPAVQ